MHHAPPTSPVTTLIIYAFVAGLLIFRFSRPQRITLTRMWAAPGITVLLSAFAIWSEQHILPIPADGLCAALIVGALCGIPIGFLRGKHTNVRATDRPGVMYLDASWIVLAIWVGAFILRAGLRMVFNHGMLSLILGDGLLAFAATTVAASYYIIYTKYRALEIQTVSRS